MTKKKRKKKITAVFRFTTMMITQLPKFSNDPEKFYELPYQLYLETSIRISPLTHPCFNRYVYMNMIFGVITVYYKNNNDNNNKIKEYVHQ